MTNNHYVDCCKTKPTICYHESTETMTIFHIKTQHFQKLDTQQKTKCSIETRAK
ncbi:hypothetical protein Hanom_Chr15g01351511 [Helianthus anomalus]